MQTVIITCETIKDEILLLLKETALPYPAIWLDAGLHRNPGRLRDQIIRELGNLTEPKRVLLPMGFCGGGVDNIPTGPHTLIVPRCDDCLTLLLGSMSKRLEIQKQAGTYFLTAGWLTGINDLIAEYEGTVARMGADRAERAYKMTMAGYKRYMLIKTGAYDPEPCRLKMNGLARLLNLDMEEIPGDLDWLRRMLTGPWEKEEFVITPPHQILRLMPIFLGEE